MTYSICVIFQWLQWSIPDNIAEVCLYANWWSTAEQIKYQESGIKFSYDCVVDSLHSAGLSVTSILFGTWVVKTRQRQHDIDHWRWQALQWAQTSN